MSSRMKLRLELILALLLCGGGMARSQTVEGSLRLQIDDGTGAVAGAAVEVVREETNHRRTGVADGDGHLLIPLLPSGTYRLEVSHAGYRKHVEKFSLRVNERLEIRMTLQPGELTEEVVVVESRGWLKRDSLALGSVIENSQVAGLPLDGRNFFELSLLLPGSAPAAPGSAGSVRGDFALNINGQREASNSFLLDGVYNGDPKLNGVGVNPPVDAIREFEVLMGTYDASFGRNVGSQINVVTKSGGNQVHGTVYGFFRNAALDARNYFSLPQGPDPEYRRSQFGFSVGGPVVRDRTFFFADYEGRRVRQGITRGTTVPTLAERSGDFSRSSGPLPVNPLTRQPFPGNAIPSPWIHPIGHAIARLYPDPNRSGEGPNFVSSPALEDRDDHFDVRVDHAASPSSTLAVRYSFGDRDLFDPFSGPLFSAVPGYGTNVPRRAQNLVVSHSHAATTRYLKQFRFAFNRVAAGAFHENMGRSLNSEVGLPDLSDRPRDLGLSFITVSGFSSLGDEYNNPQHSSSDTYQFLSHSTYARGKHLWQWGAETRFVRQDAYRDVQSRGFLNFVGQTGISGNGLADLLLGLPSLTGGARLDNPQHLRNGSVSFFVQDHFKLRPNLTLALGVRYEFNSPPVDKDDRANVYDPESGSLVGVGTGGVPRGGYRPDRNNWAPRIGLAWGLDRGGRTVLRTGYGVFYDQSPLAPGEGLYFNPPYFDFRLYFPLPGLPLTLHDPFPRNYPFALPPSVLFYQRDLAQAYSQHWNLNLQRELGTRQMIEVGYVGSKGTKLLTARDFNQPRPSPVWPNPRPVPQFDDINMLESRGNSTYHSLQARFNRRLSSGFSLLASYSWARSIDDASSFFSSTGDPNFPQDSWNVAAERARSNFDLTHRLSVSYSWEIPIGRGRSLLGDQGWLSDLLSNWQSFGIVTLQTGHPFTVALLSEIDNSNTGRSILGFGANDRPHRTSDGSISGPGPDRWFDTRAFVFPRFGSFGNSGRNILEGPGYATVDLSLVRDARISEQATIQFRAEFFNLLNRPNLHLPDLFLGSPTFGRILSAGEPRRIQLGLKLRF